MREQRGRKKMNRRRILVVLFLLIGGFTYDLAQEPENQVTASAAIVVINGYQATISEEISCIQCRYKETCSNYCKRAFKERGFLGGLVASVKRLQSCF